MIIYRNHDKKLYFYLCTDPDGSVINTWHIKKRIDDTRDIIAGTGFPKGEQLENFPKENWYQYVPWKPDEKLTLSQIREQYA